VALFDLKLADLSQSLSLIRLHNNTLLLLLSVKQLQNVFLWLGRMIDGVGVLVSKQELAKFKCVANTERFIIVFYFF